MKPRLWLDVDGPINASNPGQVWGKKALNLPVDAYGVEYIMRFSDLLMDEVRTIADSDQADVVWCTTWCMFSESLEATFNLPKLPRAFETCTRYDAWTKKVNAVRDFNAEFDVPWVWADDESPTGGPVWRSLTEKGTGLILKVSPSTGLTPKQMEQTRQWLGVDLTA